MIGEVPFPFPYFPSFFATNPVPRAVRHLTPQLFGWPGTFI
jgi:hypothetical protein